MLPTIPFNDDGASISIDSLVVENGRDKVTLYGNLDITRDKHGLAIARELMTFVARIVEVLSVDPCLPDKVMPDRQSTKVQNPFA